MDNKNITFFISSLAGGGAERVCVNIANGLADKGWSVTLVVLHLDREVYKNELNNEIKLISLDVLNARYSPFKIYKYLKKNESDRVVVFNYELAVILILIRTLTRLNFSLIARNINSLSEKMLHHGGGVRHKVLYFLMRKIYQKADYIVNQCESMQDDLASVIPSVRSKSCVIYNPVNSTLSERKSDELSSESEFILCVGRLEKQKAFHYALQSFSIVSKNYPKLRLKIVGTGSLEAELKALSTELKVADKVDFEGFNSNIAKYYRNAKATLLTSLYEGFPNVLIESISLGTPVISFDCKSGPSEIVINKVNGYLIEFQNIELMASAISKTLDNPFLSKDIIDTSAPFSKDVIIQQWEKLIDKC
ncbi:glycosyltransferase [Pseudoalteromonas sp. ACER1]|uniref:glycosyltransferase n=1 Tax=unclassified Pseudoalteromonas TaxID=194690 RepID=UPI001F37937D|nr:MULTISPECIES: glycosyltransferase [unclassified Pseudoalteromonas]MCF2848678.1 glycosyltransferase [Pseudoalteromonas sp. PAST1]MCO7209687.1 glycosyltransferase [Pseudoalteromonas sp. ACER1]